MAQLKVQASLSANRPTYSSLQTGKSRAFLTAFSSWFQRLFSWKAWVKGPGPPLPRRRGAPHPTQPPSNACPILVFRRNSPAAPMRSTPGPALSGVVWERGPCPYPRSCPGPGAPSGPTAGAVDAEGLVCLGRNVERSTPAGRDDAVEILVEGAYEEARGARTRVATRRCQSP